MKVKTFLLIIAVFFSCSCHEGDQKNIETSQDLTPNAPRIKNNIIEFEGRFESIRKINDREYYLTLSNENDSVEVFSTLMPVDENVIQRLKKTGNNLRLGYINFYHSVRQRTEKVVKYLEPIYEPQYNK